jgi:RNA 2',3'-cyclic 3'-phosphodiesterase
MMRCFVAIDPAAEVRARLVALRHELAEAGADVRWARDEGLHCTLAFLGSVEETRLDLVQEALRAALEQRAAFSMRALGVGAFPSSSRARVVWVGLESEALAALAETIGGALEPLGFAREKRPFRPHVTLGRVRSRHGWPALAALLRSHENDDLGASRIEEIVLYRSDLGPGGSRYTPVWTIALAKTSLRGSSVPTPDERGSGV